MHAWLPTVMCIYIYIYMSENVRHIIRSHYRECDVALLDSDDTITENLFILLQTFMQVIN